MSDLFAARAQMGSSLAFHIVFAALGMGMPVAMLVAEGLWLRSGDEAYLQLARTWSRAFGVLFAVGAVSGTILSFELGLLWPRFMEFAGGIIGMPFSLEGFAFFLEAIFLGLYLYGWERLSPRAHWLTGVPIAISGVTSAIFVVAANAWMNTPAGFRLVDGQVVDVDPVAAMFNTAFPTEALHMVLAALVATGFGIASVYALGLLRGRRDAHHRRGLAIGLAIGAIAAPLQIVSGDLSAEMVAANEPIKLAALEGQWKTERGAPLRIGGFPDPSSHTTPYAIEIPDGLSFLAHHNRNATIRGLDSVAAADRPDTRVVHVAFQLMVAIGFGLLALGVLAAYAWRRRPSLLANRRLLQALVLAGPAAFVAIEAGWTVTEVGRQPWVVRGFVRTSEGVTTATSIDLWFALFSAIYVLLAVTTAWLLRRLGRQRRSSAAPPEPQAVTAGG
jgi:cytochrome d ubiquinol oxidase subunit I